MVMEIRGSTIASTHPGVRILVIYISTTCAFRWRTCVRILLMHVFLMYVFWRWTWLGDIRVILMYVFYRRTSSTTYVFSVTYVIS